MSNLDTHYVIVSDPIFSNFQVSYQACRYLFIRDIGLEPTVDKDERENRIKKLMQPFNVGPYLNLLNYVLGVRFMPTEASIRLKGKKRYAMLEKLFRNLCNAVSISSLLALYAI